MNPKALLLDWLKTAAIAIAIVLFLHYFVFHLSTVEGHSMEPTLQEKEWLYVNKFVFLFGSPDIGDVVVLKDPYEAEDGKRLLVKRVVGKPGDRIEIAGGQLYRNGELVDEGYTDSIIEGESYGPVVIGEGLYFVMGDNRHERASLDSRSFGPVQSDWITGRADFIVWPLKEMKTL
ncbi:signal peptidase I [Paenibacillus sp. NPDC057967]|uniref:signal peptidase I n=1 Tax=Paenibacillus sp. NPDC057967 TaxID=3346293 RepID=UPI0036DA6E4F